MSVFFPARAPKVIAELHVIVHHVQDNKFNSILGLAPHSRLMRVRLWLLPMSAPRNDLVLALLMLEFKHLGRKMVDSIMNQVM